METNESKSLNEMFCRDLQKLKKKYLKMNITPPKPMVKFDGYEYFDEGQINVAYGYGFITEKRRALLVKQLDELERAYHAGSKGYEHIARFIDDCVESFKKGTGG